MHFIMQIILHILHIELICTFCIPLHVILHILNIYLHIMLHILHIEKCIYGAYFAN